MLGFRPLPEISESNLSKHICKENQLKIQDLELDCLYSEIKYHLMSPYYVPELWPEAI